MMRDQFANYVVQKMLDVVDGEQRELLLSRMKPHFASLKKFTYGKHILTKVEKLLGHPILIEGNGVAPPTSPTTSQGTAGSVPQRIPSSLEAGKKSFTTSSSNYGSSC